MSDSLYKEAAVFVLIYFELDHMYKEGATAVLQPPPPSKIP
jgi:hypothetical protein